MTDTYTLMEKYLDGTLAGDDLSAFEAQLRMDKLLQAELSMQRQGRAALGNVADSEAADFEKILKKNSAHYFPVESRPAGTIAKAAPRIVWRKWLAAAAVVLALVFAGLKWYATAHYKVSAILAQHYAPAATPATLSGETYDLQEAYAAYRNRKYAVAIQAFGAVPADDPQYAEALLFQGYACYESGQYGAALAAFELVIKSRDARFLHNAEWHRLLAALAENPKSETAQAYLQQILGDASHPYYAEAKKIDRQLKSPLRNLAG
jgi:hypothetical protein